MPPRKRGNLAAVPERTYPQPPDLRDALVEAIAAMQWLGPQDAAMTALAKRYAQQIETAIERADELEELWTQAHKMGDERDIFRKRLERLEAQCEATKMVGWLGPQLMGVIRELGGAALARKAFGKGSEGGKRIEGLRNRVPGATRPSNPGSGQNTT